MSEAFREGFPRMIRRIIGLYAELTAQKMLYSLSPIPGSSADLRVMFHFWSHTCHSVFLNHAYCKESSVATQHCPTYSARDGGTRSIGLEDAAAALTFRSARLCTVQSLSISSSSAAHSGGSVSQKGQADSGDSGPSIPVASHRLLATSRIPWKIGN